jgi:hypothetical protein
MVGLPLTINMVKNNCVFKKKEVVNSTEHQQKELAAKAQTQKPVEGCNSSFEM